MPALGAGPPRPPSRAMKASRQSDRSVVAVCARGPDTAPVISATGGGRQHDAVEKWYDGRFIFSARSGPLGNSQSLQTGSQEQIFPMKPAGLVGAARRSFRSATTDAGDFRWL